MGWLIDILRTPLALKFHIISHLCVACTYDKAKRYYSLYCDDEQSRRDLDEAKQHHQVVPNGARSASESTLSVNLQPRASSSNNKCNFNNNNDQLDWDWKHFPKVSPYFTTYKRFSSTMMVYFVIKNCLPFILVYLVGLVRKLCLFDCDPLQQQEERMPDSCFLLGRFQLSPSAALSDVTSALFSAYHLLWRFEGLSGLCHDGFSLFMLQTDRDIETFLQSYNRYSLDADRYIDQPAKHHSDWSMSSSVASIDTASIEPHIGGNSSGAVSLYLERRGHIKNNRRDATGSETSDCKQPDDGLSGFERLLRDVMFFKVDRPWSVSYRLRLNRTREAREELKTRLAQSWIKHLIFFAIVCPPVTVYVIFATFPDSSYVRNYPGCDRHLDQLYANDTVSSLDNWSFTLTTHRIVSFASDYVENFIVWADSGWSLLYNTAFCSLLNQDVMICCERLQAKIAMFLKRAKLEHRLRMQQQQLNDSTNKLEDTFDELAYHHKSTLEPYRFLRPPASFKDACLRDSHLSSYRKQLTHSGLNSDTNYFYSKPSMDIGHHQRRRQGEWGLELRHNTIRLSSSSTSSSSSSSGFDQAIFELQSEIKDFFDQISTADEFYSTFLTAYIIIWFCTRSALSYYSLKVTKLDVPIAVHMLQVFNFCLMSFLSWNAFQLHGACIRTCRLMCSLMAFDQSRYKKGFAKILDFYCNHKKCGYTLFHQYPYTPTTYLSIIGWSFSCFFIIHSLFKQY